MAKRDYYLKSSLGESLGNFAEVCKSIVESERPTTEDFLKLFKLLKRDKELRSVWPGNILYWRIRPLAENIQDSDLGELVLLLKQIASSEPNAIDLLTGEKWLALNTPVPDIAFQGKVFCFLCSFAFGSKEKCKEAVSYLGGGWTWNADELTDYVIVGVKGRELFVIDNDCKSLEAAKQMKADGGKCKIVLEEHWIRALPQEPDFLNKISGCNNYAGPKLSFSMGMDADGNVQTSTSTEPQWRPDVQS